MRILLVEDDKLIGDGIQMGLSKMGFTVDWFTDGQTGQDALFSAPYDAVILDLGLPKKDGLDVLSFWRQKKSETPVLILTARDAIEQRVEGLQKGADDYLCKPFALAELAARLQALIRRNHGHVEETLSFGDVVLYPAAQKVTKSGQEINLTVKEVAILELFLLSKNKVMTRELIQEKLYSWNDDVSSNTVDVYIHNLRRKLGNKIIQTVYGMGYKLGDDNEKA